MALHDVGYGVVVCVVVCVVDVGVVLVGVVVTDVVEVEVVTVVVLVVGVYALHRTPSLTLLHDAKHMLTYSFPLLGEHTGALYRAVH